jgi:hypothetical protein
LAASGDPANAERRNVAIETRHSPQLLPISREDYENDPPLQSSILAFSNA